IFRIIPRLTAEGTAVLLVEQNARMALQCAAHAYVLQTGQVVLSGPRRICSPRRKSSARTSVRARRRDLPGQGTAALGPLSSVQSARDRPGPGSPEPCRPVAERAREERASRARGGPSILAEAARNDRAARGARRVRGASGRR